jgi:hypothetical protein
MSVGGTNAAPGATMGLTDTDPSTFKMHFFYNNGGTYTQVPIAWSGHFDHVSMLLNMVTNTWDVSVTLDSNFVTPEFDPGNLPVFSATGIAMTNSFSLLDYMYFRTHTDPGNGIQTAGLEKSFLDNFSFAVVPVPEPSCVAMVAIGGAALLRRRAFNTN